MDTLDAIKTRKCIRKFLDTPVEKEKIDAILETAVRTPSWANSQPWEVFIVSGAPLERIKEGYEEKYLNKAPHELETPRPAAWPENAKDRQKGLRPGIIRDCGEEAANQFVMLNQTMFSTPMIIFIGIDKMLGEWAMYDIGAYSQSLMVAANELGLGTIPAVQLMNFPDILRKEMEIPENIKLAIGIAIGYEDTSHDINKFVSERSPLNETVRFFD